MEECCHICARPVEYIAYGECGQNHKNEICCNCIVRLRWIQQNKRCQVCQYECETIYGTIFQGDYTNVISKEEFKELPAKAKAGQLYYIQSIGGYFEDKVLYQQMKQLCSVTHPMVEQIRAEGHQIPLIVKISQLKRFIQEKKKLQFCTLCLEHRQVFVSEQLLYDRKQLDQHNRHGDSSGPLHEAGFKGHPLCEFCQRRFYSESELFPHMEREHFTCFLCKQTQGDSAISRPTYYKDYSDLEEHFKKKHFPCMHPTCLAEKFVVFRSQFELVKHTKAAHQNDTPVTDQDLKQAARLVPGFVIERPQDDVVVRGRRGGRGGRGRGRQEDITFSEGPSASATIPHSRSQQYLPRGPELFDAEFPEIAPTSGDVFMGRWEGSSTIRMNTGRLREADFPSLPGGPSQPAAAAKNYKRREKAREKRAVAGSSGQGSVAGSDVASTTSASTASRARPSTAAPAPAAAQEEWQQARGAGGGKWSTGKPGIRADGGAVVTIGHVASSGTRGGDGAPTWVPPKKQVKQESREEAWPELSTFGGLPVAQSKGKGKGKAKAQPSLQQQQYSSSQAQSSHVQSDYSGAEGYVPVMPRGTGPSQGGPSAGGSGGQATSRGEANGVHGNNKQPSNCGKALIDELKQRLDGATFKFLSECTSHFSRQPLSQAAVEDYLMQLYTIKLAQFVPRLAYSCPDVAKRDAVITIFKLHVDDAAKNKRKSVIMQWDSDVSVQQLRNAIQSVTGAQSQGDSTDAQLINDVQTMSVGQNSSQGARAATNASGGQVANGASQGAGDMIGFNEQSSGSQEQPGSGSASQSPGQAGKSKGGKGKKQKGKKLTIEELMRVDENGISEPVFPSSKRQVKPKQKFNAWEQ